MPIHTVIDWNKKSCNTCTRGAVHSHVHQGVGWSLSLKMPKGCRYAKICDRKFSEHKPHKKFIGALIDKL